MTKKVSKTDVENAVLTMSLADLRKLNIKYAAANHIDVETSFQKLLTTDLQNRLVALDINSTCPYCHSNHITKYGTRPNGVQRYKCNDCDRNFTPFTNTMLEKTKWHWDLWVEVIYCMLNNISIKSTQQTLIDDYHALSIDTKTIFNWKHKIMEAAKAIPSPELHGVVQIDETHLHEAQKGSRNLENYFDASKTRKARERAKASKYGVMGAEFGTVICAVDKTGHTICRVSGLGKFDLATFERLFMPYISDISYLCTDANSVYISFSSKYNIKHYVRPSDYLANQNAFSGRGEKWIYDNGFADYMANTSKIPFNKFKKLVNDNGLTLSGVNGVHSRIKTYIDSEMHGVSTKAFRILYCMV